MATQTVSVDDGAEIETARAAPYRLLSRLLAAPPNAHVMAMIRQLHGDTSDIGMALQAMGDIGRRLDIDAVRREYQQLFIGIGRGELVPFGSFYLTGFLHEKPLAILRDDLATLGIAREDEVPEPEDHVAALCEVMAGLITGDLVPAAGDEDLAAQKAFFERHLDPWVGRFAADLEAAQSAVFYTPVGTLLKALMQIERTAFAFVTSDGESAANPPTRQLS